MRRLPSLPNILIILGLLFLLLSFGPLIKDELWFYFMKLKNQSYLLDKNAKEESVFAKFLTSTPIYMKPINTEFSLMIEKIGVNAPVIADVSVANEQVYKEALKMGVAHAAFSDYPSEKPGNVFLFAHASLNFWDLGKYATVFNLLRKLSYKDKVYVFYKEKTYVYEVLGKDIVPGWSTELITRPTIEPLLTLQTCDPPGTTLNRLIVTAKLKEIK